MHSAVDEFDGTYTLLILELFVVTRMYEQNQTVVKAMVAIAIAYLRS